MKIETYIPGPAPKNGFPTLETGIHVDRTDDLLCAVLTRDDALIIWPRVEPLLKRATDRSASRNTPETIRKMIAAGDAILWTYKDLSLVYVTTIEQYPTGKKSCLIFLGAGKGLDKCREMEKVICDYARAIDCDMVEILGREGWLRVFGDYTKDSTLMRKELC